MVKYSSVNTKYSTVAKKFEKEAGKYKSSNTIRYTPKATESYEHAGDSWVKDSVKRKGAQEEFRNSLSYAVADYNSAIKSLDGKNKPELKRIGNKLKSVEDKLGDSSKVRDSRKVTEKGLVLRTMNSELALPTLSIAVFSIALLFSSFSMTGFAINQSSILLPNYIALAFFMVGFILVITYFRKGKILKNINSSL